MKSCPKKNEWQRKRRANFTKEEKLRILQKSREWAATPRGWASCVTSSAKKRAKKQKIPFELTKDFVVSLIPEDGLCPILKEPFVMGRVDPMNMSLDRLKPNLGYVNGNVRIISRKANTMKLDCSDPEVFYRLYSYVCGELDWQL